MGGQWRLDRGRLDRRNDSGIPSFIIYLYIGVMGPKRLKTAGLSKYIDYLTGYGAVHKESTFSDSGYH